MKTLVLSTKTGQGHQSASMALQKSLQEMGCEAVVADILKSGNGNASAKVSALYDHIVIHAPKFFGMLYHAGEVVSSSRHHSPIYYLNSLYAKKLYEGIREIRPDVIVCTHIFSAQAVTRLKEKYGLSVPAFGIMTDYTCSPFWEETRLEGYVIPAPQLMDEFTGKGIPESKLYPLGIPVDPRFKAKKTASEARSAFGITADRVVVLMGGSMGYGRIYELVRLLTQKLPDIQAAAVCGRNERLYQRLSGLHNVIPFPYIENIDLLMDAADVLITKPGGLSATEAVNKRLPVILTNPLPGGEVRNAAFLSAIGAALYAPAPEEAADMAAGLLQNPAECARMREIQEKYINKDADKDIARLIIQTAMHMRGDCSCCGVSS